MVTEEYARVAAEVYNDPAWVWRAFVLPGLKANNPAAYGRVFSLWLSFVRDATAYTASYTTWPTSADVDHSWLLARMLRGHAPLPPAEYEEWKARDFAGGYRYLDARTIAESGGA